VPEENIITDIEQTLKSVIEACASVPVQIVTPDPDYIELELPCITLELADVRRDPARIMEDRQVEKDIDAMKAEVKPRTEPFNFHYTLGVHTGTTREGRLLLEKMLLLIDRRPILVTQVFGKEVYLSRDLAFAQRSGGRDFFHTIGLIVKARLYPEEVETVPLVKEAEFSAKEV